MTYQPALFLKKEWKDIAVEYCVMEAVGEFDFTMPKHAISVAFVPHDRVTWSVDGLKQTTPLPAGSAFLYGDREFVWHQRKKTSEYVTIYLEPLFLRRTAIENELSAETKLAHRVIFPDSTIVQVAHLFKGELLNEGLAGALERGIIEEFAGGSLAASVLRKFFSEKTGNFWRGVGCREAEAGSGLHRGAFGRRDCD